MDTKPLRELIEAAKKLGGVLLAVKSENTPEFMGYIQEVIPVADKAIAAAERALAEWPSDPPPTDLAALAGGIPEDEDIDAFVKVIYDAREARGLE